MTRRSACSILGTFGAASLLVVSCGSDPAKTSATEQQGGYGGEGDVAGASAQSGGGSKPEGGSAHGGSPEAGAAPIPAAGAGGVDGTLGGADGGGAGGASSTAGAGGDAGAGGSGDVTPPVTVDADCLPPSTLNRLSPAAAGLPTDGLQLWLRADRGIYATAANRVCAWMDQSGNDNVFYANGQNRALWTAAGLGMQPAIDFDATGRWLSAGGVLGIPATAGRTLIAVVQLVNTTGRFTALMQGLGNSAGTYVNLDTNTFQTAGSREGVYVTNNSYDAATATGTDPRVHVFTIGTMVPTTPVLSTVDYRINGVTQVLERNPGGLGNGNVESFAAANFTLVGSGTRALVAEAILYGRPLGVEERSAVEKALRTRYGIPD